MIINEPIDIPIIDTIIELEERNREDLQISQIVILNILNLKQPHWATIRYLQRRSTSCCYR
jgi:hypothetical protein